MSCSKGLRQCHRKCLHRALVQDFRDAVDARDALREQGDQIQMEDDEFDERFPKVLFKDWLIGMKRN